jgi:DNA transformation protein and related proteins
MNKKDDSFKDFVLDQLQGLDDVEARRMFGGFGVIRMKPFSGSSTRGGSILRSMTPRVGEYRKRKMKPFRPSEKQTLKSYYQVPVDIIEDGDRLCQWAVTAIPCQQFNK